MEVGSVSALDRYSRVGLWLLPVYGLANFVGTITSQPDYNKNFPAYARYVRTDEFRASHLAASVLGTGVGLLGFTALFVYLAVRSRRPGVALAGFVLSLLSNMFLVAVFGVATFAQPAIGQAYLAGHHDVVALNSSVYDNHVNVTAAIGILSFFAGVILFAIAIAASESLPRWAGGLFAAAVPIFAIGSIMGNLLAQIGALMQIAAAIWIAHSASRYADVPDREPQLTSTS
jgi:hypothetical protein